jgi:hypothetical protein
MVEPPRVSFCGGHLASRKAEEAGTDLPSPSLPLQFIHRFTFSYSIFRKLGYSFCRGLSSFGGVRNFRIRVSIDHLGVNEVGVRGSYDVPGSIATSLSHVLLLLFDWLDRASRNHNPESITTALRVNTHH